MDHSSITIRNSSFSCGVIELSGFTNEVDRMLFQLASYLYHPSRGQPAAIVVWSDLAPEEMDGKWMAALNGLTDGSDYGAKVQASLSAENPKTGNVICVYTWVIPHKQFKAWYQEERIKRIKKQNPSQ